MVEDEPNDDERKGLAAQISADPAFTSLEASGAPIVALVGGEPRVVYANATAAAIFGANPDARLFLGPEGGEERLTRLMEQLRKSGAPRLERLPLAFDDEARVVTVLCRRITPEGGAPIYVVAALGLRPAPAAPDARNGAEIPVVAGSAGQHDETRDLRERLVARHRAKVARFLWRTDAAGRFVDVTHVLADVAGRESADILGRNVADVSRAFSFEPAFAAALASQKSWSGVEVNWPFEEPFCEVPTSLGALPIYDEARRFAGFQGYGVLRLDRAAAREARPTPQLPPAKIETIPEKAPSPPTGDNIVPLRPLQVAPAREENAPQQNALSQIEKSAFDEIGRTLVPMGGPFAPSPPTSAGPARDLIAHVSRVLEDSRANPLDATLSRAALIDVLPIGVLVARGPSALYANKTLLDYLGYADLAELNEQGGLARVFAGQFHRLQPPRDALRAVEVTAQDGESLDVEAHVQSVDWEGGPATLISLRRHVAPPFEADPEALRVRGENALLQRAFEEGMEARAIVTAEGRVDRANAAFAARFEAIREALSGRELASLFDTEDARRVAGFFASGGKTGDILLAGRKRLALREIGAEPKRLLCALLQDQAQDDTKELEQARATAERASAAKSEFLARVSHEIRTPLSAILGFAEVMIEERFGPIGSERYKEYLKDVHASGAHVLSLVNDLLDLSKIEAGKMELSVEPIEVNAIIGECVSIMQTQANKQRVIMRLSLAPRLPRIRADKRSLRQILLNLLSNAVKFNVPGGQVIVSSAETDAGYVVIRVKDTGIGMTDDDISVALEPFGQLETSRKTSGTGLGLPVTKALVEANHATFLIQSRKNEGTLIEVGFPPRAGLAAE
jgi:signal transduction histidine kinase